MGGGSSPYSFNDLDRFYVPEPIATYHLPPCVWSTLNEFGSITGMSTALQSTIKAIDLWQISALASLELQDLKLTENALL